MQNYLEILKLRDTFSDIFFYINNKFKFHVCLSFAMSGVTVCDVLKGQKIIFEAEPIISAGTLFKLHYFSIFKVAFVPQQTAASTRMLWRSFNS